MKEKDVPKQEERRPVILNVLSDKKETETGDVLVPIVVEDSSSEIDERRGAVTYQSIHIASQVNITLSNSAESNDNSFLGGLLSRVLKGG